MIYWWISLGGSTVGFTLGSLLLKRYADTSALVSLLLAFAVLTASNLLFVHVIRAGLGQGIIASSMLQVVLIAAFGVLMFGESLSTTKIIGVVLAVFSIFLITHPGVYSRAE